MRVSASAERVGQEGRWDKEDVRGEGVWVGFHLQATKGDASIPPKQSNFPPPKRLTVSLHHTDHT